MRRIFQPNITIRSVRPHYQTQPTPGTRNTTHQITARHNKKAIGQYKPIDCITHGLSQTHHIIVLYISRYGLHHIKPHSRADNTIIFR